MRKILVLGLGNDLYGDDAIGLHVIDRLRREDRHSDGGGARFKGVDFIPCSLTGLALLDVIADYDTLIIVDTIKREAPETGRITILDAAELRHIPGPSPHYVSIPQAIEIGKKAGLRMPSSIKVVAVESRNMHTMGEGLSEEMTRALPTIVDRTRKLIIGSLDRD